MKLSTLILFLVLGSHLLFGQNLKEKEGFTGELTILHTNDIHGNFSRFARLAYMVDSIRTVNENVLLLNAGDIFTGNPLVDMNAEKGIQMLELMNMVAFDASVLGNHEFDYGQKVLAKRMSEAQFPFVCANVWNQNNDFKLPEGFIRLRMNNNLSVNILGLLDNSINGKPETHPDRVKGFLFTDPIETAAKFRYLNSSSEVFFALTHLGDEQDIELAKEMPFFDLIIGGHTHSKIDSVLLVNNVLVSQAGSHLKYLGEITVTFKNGEIANKTSKLLPLDKNAPSKSEIEQLVKKYKQNPLFAEVAGRANGDITGKEELGSFFTDALRFEANLDIAFQNSGGIRIDKIAAGEINKGQIFKMDPFGNYLMILEMDISEIKSLIRYSFENWGIDLRVSGIEYTVTTADNKIKSIEIKDYQGKQLDENKKYRVGMNDYILSSYQFKHKDPGQSFGATTAEIIISYLKKQRSISYKGVKRTFLKNK